MTVGNAPTLLAILRYDPRVWSNGSVNQAVLEQLYGRVTPNLAIEARGIVDQVVAEKASGNDPAAKLQSILTTKPDVWNADGSLNEQQLRVYMPEAFNAGRALGGVEKAAVQNAVAEVSGKKNAIEAFVAANPGFKNQDGSLNTAKFNAEGPESLRGAITPETQGYYGQKLGAASADTSPYRTQLDALGALSENSDDEAIASAVSNVFQTPEGARAFALLRKSLDFSGKTKLTPEETAELEGYKPLIQALQPYLGRISELVTKDKDDVAGYNSNVDATNAYNRRVYDQFTADKKTYDDAENAYKVWAAQHQKDVEYNDQVDKDVADGKYSVDAYKFLTSGQATLDDIKSIRQQYAAGNRLVVPPSMVPKKKDVTDAPERLTAPELHLLGEDGGTPSMDKYSAFYKAFGIEPGKLNTVQKFGEPDLSAPVVSQYANNTTAAVAPTTTQPATAPTTTQPATAPTTTQPATGSTQATLAAPVTSATSTRTAPKTETAEVKPDTFVADPTAVPVNTPPLKDEKDDSFTVA